MSEHEQDEMTFDAGAASKKLGLQVQAELTPQRIYAEAAMDGVCVNAMTTHHFAVNQMSGLSLDEAVFVLKDRAKAVHQGDLKQAETMLISQAVALESIFAEMARRASNNLGKNLDIAERYMRMSLKAQNQCRTTLETLAEMKNPTTVFARQANIANGPQQVNNSVALSNGDVSQARAREAKSGRNELLVEISDGRKKVERRTTRAAAQSHTAVETVGAVNRTSKRPRKA